MGGADVTLGVHIAAGTAWLAVVGTDGRLVTDPEDRIELAVGDLAEPRALAEWEETAQALLRRLRPSVVVLLDPGTSTWATRRSDVLKRGRLEGALMIAAYRSGCTVRHISHQAVKNATGARPSDKEFATRLAARVDELPTRWAERSCAFGAALAIMGGKR